MQNNIPKSYKPIPSFPGYYLNESGQIVKVYKNGSQYVLSSNNKNAVVLVKDGKKYCRSLTKILMEVMYGAKSTRKKKVSGMNTKDGPLKWIEFDSLKEASECTGVPVSYISKVINCTGGDRYATCGWIFRTEVPNV